jgi:uncharacterized membrane protein
MQLSQLHYLPLTPPFFSLLVGVFIVLVVLLQLGILRYAYMRIGLSPGAAIFLLLGSLIGSYFNIPIAELPRSRSCPDARWSISACAMPSRWWCSGPAPSSR